MSFLRVSVDYPNRGFKKSREFNRSPVRIGRNEFNDLQLKSGYVSQMHALVRFDSESAEYLDLGSTNGTVFNNVRLQAYEPTRVHRGDRVMIGPIALSFECEATAKQAVGKVHPSEKKGTRVDADMIQQRRLAQSALESIAPVYESYRASWAAALEVIANALQPVDANVSIRIVELLEERFPAVGQEPEFIALRNRVLGGSSDGKQTLANADPWVRALGLDSAQPTSAMPRAQLQQRLAELLMVFCSSFLELRNGMENFSNELAVRTFKCRTPLHDAETPQGVLTYLIGKDKSEQDRVQDLKSAFADMMIHQVALISGVMEGVRGLLQRLGPTAIARDLDKAPVRLGPFKLPRRIWPLSVFAAWSRFVKMHREFLEEDQEISSVLFGKEFAQSYGATKGAVKSDSQVDKPPESKRSTDAF